jgi:hypothetical protein
MYNPSTFAQESDQNLLCFVGEIRRMFYTGVDRADPSPFIVQAGSSIRSDLAGGTPFY